MFHIPLFWINTVAILIILLMKTFKKLRGVHMTGTCVRRLEDGTQKCCLQTRESLKQNTPKDTLMFLS